MNLLPLVRARHALSSRYRSTPLVPQRRVIRPPHAKRDEDRYTGDDLDEDDTFWEQFGEAAEDGAFEDQYEDSVAYDPTKVAAQSSRDELRMHLIDEPSSGIPVLPVLGGIGIIVAAILWKRNSGSGPDSAAETASQDTDDGEVRSRACFAPLHAIIMVSC